MCLRFFLGGGLLALFLFRPVPLCAQAVPQATLNAVEAAYVDGDFDRAFSLLASVPGLLGVVPIFDQPAPTERARLFFDLGRIRLAAGDTTRARLVLSHIAGLDSQVRKGILHVPQDAAFENTRNFLSELWAQEYNRKLRLASKLGALVRSTVFPGWGQIYRGHRKRGYFLMGATAGLAAFWAIADQSYRRAYDDYRKTRIEDLELSRRTGTAQDPLPFKARYDRAKSRASTANVALGMLAALWLGNIFDNVLIGPAQVSIVTSIP